MAATQSADLHLPKPTNKTVLWSILVAVLVAVAAILWGYSRSVATHSGVNGSDVHPVGSYQNAPARVPAVGNAATDGREAPQVGGADDNQNSGGPAAGTH